jgi:hypothetical protein
VRRQTTSLDGSVGADDGFIGTLFKKLRHFTIFQKNDSLSPGAAPQLEDSVIKTVLKLSSQGDGKEDSKDKNEVTKLKNARINKNKLVNFLRKRYTGRLVQKVASIFDWSNGNVEPEVFYHRLDDVLLHPKECSNDAAAYLRTLKRFAF